MKGRERVQVVRERERERERGGGRREERLPAGVQVPSLQWSWYDLHGQ